MPFTRCLGQNLGRNYSLSEKQVGFAKDLEFPTWCLATLPFQEYLSHSLRTCPSHLSSWNDPMTTRTDTDYQVLKKFYRDLQTALLRGERVPLPPSGYDTWEDYFLYGEAFIELPDLEVPNALDSSEQPVQ